MKRRGGEWYDDEARKTLRKMEGKVAKARRARGPTQGSLKPEEETTAGDRSEHNVRFRTLDEALKHLDNLNE